jgi:hypothetical protein
MVGIRGRVEMTASIGLMGPTLTSDLAGTIPFCRVTLAPRQSFRPRTIKALTRADAKRAIVEALC